MTPLPDTPLIDVLHEWLVLRPVFDHLVGRVCPPGTDPATVPLADVLTGLNSMGGARFAAFVFSLHYGETADEAADIAEAVRVMIRQNRRPRTTTDMLSPADLATIREATP